MKVSKSIFSCFLLLTIYYLLFTISLPALQFTDLSEDLKNFQASIYALGYSPSQDYWLIGGSGGGLARYDDETGFVNLNDLINLSVINCIKWGGTGYWLIGGNDARLVKYDGNIAVDLSGELKNFSREDIKSIGWNGSYWLLGGDNGKLNRYKDGRFTDLSMEEEGFDSSEIKAIGWNGSYWLIGGTEGQLKRYERRGTGWKFLDLTAQLDFGGETIQSIAWNAQGEYWLLGGGSKVIKYKCDGENEWEDLTGLLNLTMNISSLVWTGEYWLAGGGDVFGKEKLVGFKVVPGTTPSRITDWRNWTDSLKDFAPTGIFVLDYYPGKCGLLGGKFARLNKIKYDGDERKFTFEKLHSDPEFQDSFRGDDIQALGWNGQYWLIGGGEGKTNKYDGEVFEDYSGEIDVGGVNIFTIYSNGEYWLLGGEVPKSLVRYDEKTKVSISPPLCNFEEEPVTTLSWNGEYWLIGGRNGKLNKYAGESFTDLSGSPNFSIGLLQVDITSIAWGGGYWLIGGEDRLNLYDGQIFIDLSEGLISVAGEGKVLDYGGYWLLGGKPARLCRYEEDFFSNLSPQLVNFGRAGVSAIGWNGQYWLIGGSEGKLNKYDGKDFQDLSARLVNFGSKDITCIDWNGSYWLIAGKNGRLNKIQDYPEIPAGIKLVLYNNLFNPTEGEKVSIRYNLPQITHITIEIYNLWGDRAKILFDAEQISGQHTLDWFGENDRGDTVASGIYLIYFKTKTPSFTETRKVCVIK